MAKNKKPVHQVLSPENYIRQKARNLPLYECLINTGWKEHGSAEIIVVRKHANDNLTFGIYLVDVYCLGVKDSFYSFNQSVEEYEDLISNLSQEMEIITVDYTLAHNIVFAAIEYAAELGFKPCKEFNQTTKFILEEDTEDVEPIEIECGHNGKPMFVKTDAITDLQADGIIQQLEKAVGKGNYDVLMVDRFDDEDDDFTPSEPEPKLLAEYDAMKGNERQNTFMSLAVKETEDISDEGFARLIAVSESIYANDLVDTAEIDRLFQTWSAELRVEIAEEDYTSESLGLSPDRLLTDDDINEFANLDFGYDDAEDDDNQELQKQAFDELKAIWGDIPYLCYCELKFYKIMTPAFDSKLIKGYEKYPDYPLLKLEMAKKNIFVDKNTDDAKISFEDIFGNRTTVTNMEMFEFQLFKILVMIEKDGVNILEPEAEYQFLDEIGLDHDYEQSLKTMLLTVKINKLQDYFNDKVKSN